jgi:hypothetical protein
VHLVSVAIDVVIIAFVGKRSPDIAGEADGRSRREKDPHSSSLSDRAGAVETSAGRGHRVIPAPLVFGVTVLRFVDDAD